MTSSSHAASSASTETQSARWAKPLCLAGAGLGALGLLGWLTGIEALKTLVPNQPPMMPNTAIALVLLGLAGALRAARPTAALRWLSALAAIVPLTIGVVTIAEYVFDLPFSIDQTLLRTEDEPYPGRPSPPVALALSLLSVAILAFYWPTAGRFHPSEWLILYAGLIAFTFAVAQLLGAGPNYLVLNTVVIGVAVPTAFSLMLISTGLLFGQTGSVIMRIANPSTPGGVMLRRLAPAFVLIALAIALAGSVLLSIVGPENIAILRAGLTVFGIALVLPLFVITAMRLNRTHEALENSEARYRELIGLASDGIFVADLEGRFTEVNDAGCRLLGCSREEILGKTIMDFIRPEEVERLFSHRERFLKGGTDLGEWMLRRKDGSFLPVEVSAKILPDGRWIAIDRDISERKRAEDAFHQVQERFELALKGADLATWDWDVSTGEVVSNPRCAQMRGFQPEELSSRVEGYIASIHPDDLLGFQTAIRECLEGHSDFECEYRVSTKGGDWIWLLSKGRVFGDEKDGKPIRMVGTALDITARKRAESEQRLLAEVASLSAEKLEFDERLTHIAQLLVREMADLCIVDLVEEKNGIRRARVACRATDKEWLCDALMRAGISGEQRTKALVLQTGEGLLIEKVTPDAFGYWARSREDRAALESAGFRSAILAPLAAGGKSLGMVSLVSFARTFGETDLRMAEAVTQRAALVLDNARLFAAAMRAAKVRDDMLGIVAHDLRNPLAAIATLADVLQHTGGAEREVGDEIAHAANRMKRLIRDLIDVTLLEARALTVEPEALPTSWLLSELVESQSPLAAAVSLELRLDAAPDLPEIWADHDRLLQVFENLIGNAIKFTDPGGRVTVGAKAGADEVLFSVADTGCGIASPDMENVFDRFWQAPSARRRGAGLGLPIVKGIVEAHGGRVWAQSWPGQGSTFFFTVPVAMRGAGAQRANQRRERVSGAQG